VGGAALAHGYGPSALAGCKRYPLSSIEPLKVHGVATSSLFENSGDGLSSPSDRLESRSHSALPEFFNGLLGATLHFSGNGSRRFRMSGLMTRPTRLQGDEYFDLCSELRSDGIPAPEHPGSKDQHAVF